MLNTTLTLACGPYFDPAGLLLSFVLFLVVKPLAYFAFIQAFRYRVSRPIPMRFSQAFKLTLARAGLGILIIGIGAMLLIMSINAMQHSSSRAGAVLTGISWVYLYAERLFSWWLVGWRGAGLAGRRLVGWVISGTLINAAFDVGMVMGLLSGSGAFRSLGLGDDSLLPVGALAMLIGIFITTLHIVGRRDSLRRQFAIHRCTQCGYDLTGNLSGRCPECGQSVMAPQWKSAAAMT